MKYSGEYGARTLAAYGIALYSAPPDFMEVLILWQL